MNRLEVTVVSVLKEPWQEVNEEECCWKVVVQTECYGSTKIKTFEATSKKAISRYVIGYSWEE